MLVLNVLASIKRWAISCAFITLGLLSTSVLQAKEAPLEHLDWAMSIWNQLDRQQGEVQIKQAHVSLWIPEYYYFLGKSNTRLVLEEVWRNPEDKAQFGLIFPAEQTPFDGDSWAVSLRYDASGHVLDHQAATTNASVLEQLLKKEYRKFSQQRLAKGGSAVEFLGWASPPQYDADLKVLFWPMVMRFEGRAEEVLNYKVRRFGRVGTVELNFIGPMSSFEEIEDHLIEVVAMIEFDPGFRYNDFTFGLDKVSKDDFWPQALVTETGGQESTSWRVRLLQFLALPMLIIIAHQLYALFWRKPKPSSN